VNYKDILAKLLATENLSVVHENVPTAAFNVKERVLTLPVWDDMQDFTYDHLVGHEVGHALYTPAEGLHDAVSERGPAFKSFLNVIEDARIEKLIQRKYPGLRREFVKSYRKMLADGFFGGDVDEINDMRLIDRINTYFKCGVSAKIRLSADEMKWVREIETLETWEQVVDLANRLFDSEEEQYKQEQENIKIPVPGEDGDEDGEEESSFYGESLDGDIDEEDDLFDEGESINDDVPYSEMNSSPLSSKTDESLRQSILKEHSSDVEVTNINVGTVDPTPFIIGYKKLLEETSDLNKMFRYSLSWELTNGKLNLDPVANSLYTKFMANNKKTINYLVKEFEMKKSATNYSRSYIAKTGVIDPVKMNTYRYNDDIFRKVNITPDGKNHGMIMYLDWSGSMCKDLYNTVEQTLNLVYFCRQVNIPFRVYSFTNGYDDPNIDYNVRTVEDNLFNETLSNIDDFSIYPDRKFRLMELFSNKMNKNQFARMTKVLLTISRYIEYVEEPYKLSGTPLDQSIVLAGQITRKFLKSNPVDIINTIFLTDGDSHAPTIKLSKQYNDTKYCYTEYLDSLLPYRFSEQELKRVVLHDPVTKRSYTITRDTVTKQLLKLYKDQTGSTVIGYRLMEPNRHAFLRSFARNRRDENKVAEYYEDFKKQNYVNIKGQGYDKFFVLKGGKNLQTSNNSFQVSEDAKKGDISRAFRNANKKRLVSRSMLNEFIAEVA